MKLKEAIEYYDSSESSKERDYAKFLFSIAIDIGDEEAEELLAQAEAESKFISKNYDDLIDGDYILVDTLP